MKNLNTYIQEGLFNNIGIGPEQQIERWFNDNFIDKNRIEDNKEFLIPSKRYFGVVYFINPDDYTVDISLHDGAATDIFNYKFEKIHVPKYIKINKLYINTYGLKINNFEAEDWASFLPKKIIYGRKIRELCIEECNIDNQNLQNFLTLFEKFPIHNLDITNCSLITECDIKINSKEAIMANFSGCNLKKLTGEIKSLRNSVYLNIAWNKKYIPDLSNLEIFTYNGHIDLGIYGSKLEQEVQNKYNLNPKDPDIYSINKIFKDIRKNTNKECTSISVTGKLKGVHFTKDDFYFSSMI